MQIVIKVLVRVAKIGEVRCLLRELFKRACDAAGCIPLTNSFIRHGYGALQSTQCKEVAVEIYFVARDLAIEEQVVFWQL